MEKKSISSLFNEIIMESQNLRIDQFRIGHFGDIKACKIQITNLRCADGGYSLVDSWGSNPAEFKFIDCSLLSGSEEFTNKTFIKLGRGEGSVINKPNAKYTSNKYWTITKNKFFFFCTEFSHPCLPGSWEENVEINWLYALLDKTYMAIFNNKNTVLNFFKIKNVVHETKQLYPII